MKALKDDIFYTTDEKTLCDESAQALWKEVMGCLYAEGNRMWLPEETVDHVYAKAVGTDRKARIGLDRINQLLELDVVSILSSVSESDGQNTNNCLFAYLNQLRIHTKVGVITTDPIFAKEVMDLEANTPAIQGYSIEIFGSDETTEKERKADPMEMKPLASTEQTMNREQNETPSVAPSMSGFAGIKQVKELPFFKDTGSQQVMPGEEKRTVVKSGESDPKDMHPLAKATPMKNEPFRRDVTPPVATPATPAPEKTVSLKQLLLNAGWSAIAEGGSEKFIRMICSAGPILAHYLELEVNNGVSCTLRDIYPLRIPVGSNGQTDQVIWEINQLLPLGHFSVSKDTDRRLMFEVSMTPDSPVAVNVLSSYAVLAMSSYSAKILDAMTSAIPCAS